MRNIYGVAGSFAVGVLLAGCAAQPAPPMAAAPPPMAAAPTTASGSVDGVYRSPPGGISGNSRCGTTKFGYPIRVAGGVASMASVANGTLEGPVGPDNSISIEKGRAGLRASSPTANSLEHTAAAAARTP